MKSPARTGMKSAFSRHLQEVDGINRVKLPNEFCILGAQHSEPFCSVRAPGMDGWQRSSDMNKCLLPLLGSGSPCLNEEPPITQSGIPASYFGASISWK